MKIAIATAAVLAAAAMPLQAANWQVSGVLEGTQEVPPNGSTASGSMFGMYDDATNTFEWLVQFAGLTGGPAQGGHFHEAAVGQNGPVFVNFTDQVTGSTSGSANGVSIFTAGQEVSLLNTGVYANIHTPEFPGGEIRAQLVATLVPEPGTWAMMGLGLAALGAVARRRA